MLDHSSSSSSSFGFLGHEVMGCVYCFMSCPFFFSRLCAFCSLQLAPALALELAICSSPIFVFPLSDGLISLFSIHYLLAVYCTSF